jgi:hypothetical protein
MIGKRKRNPFFTIHLDIDLGTGIAPPTVTSANNPRLKGFGFGNLQKRFGLLELQQVMELFGIWCWALGFKKLVLGVLDVFLLICLASAPSLQMVCRLLKS